MAADGEPHVDWWRVAAGFVLSLALALAIIYGLWARQQPRGRLASRLGQAFNVLQAPPRRMRLVETLKLTPQVDLCLIHLEDTELAVAAGPQGGSLVFMRPRPAEAQAADGPTPC